MLCEQKTVITLEDYKGKKCYQNTFTFAAIFNDYRAIKTNRATDRNLFFPNRFSHLPGIYPDFLRQDHLSRIYFYIHITFL